MINNILHWSCHYVFVSPYHKDLPTSAISDTPGKILYARANKDSLIVAFDLCSNVSRPYFVQIIPSVLIALCSRTYKPQLNAPVTASHVNAIQKGEAASLRRGRISRPTNLGDWKGYLQARICYGK